MKKIPGGGGQGGWEFIKKLLTVEEDSTAITLKT